MVLNRFLHSTLLRCPLYAAAWTASGSIDPVNEAGLCYPFDATHRGFKVRRLGRKGKGGLGRSSRVVDAVQEGRTSREARGVREEEGVGRLSPSATWCQRPE